MVRSLGRLIILKSPGMFARLSNARELSSLHPARRAATANVTGCRTPDAFRIWKSERGTGFRRVLRVRFDGNANRGANHHSDRHHKPKDHPPRPYPPNSPASAALPQRRSLAGPSFCIRQNPGDDFFPRSAHVEVQVAVGTSSRQGFIDCIVGVRHRLPAGLGGFL